jgi:hypothetical protein
MQEVLHEISVEGGKNNEKNDDHNPAIHNGYSGCWFVCFCPA